MIAVSAFSCTSLGLVVGALGLRARDVFFLANLVVYALLLFCGVNIPLDTLPGWMQAVGRWLPLTHGIEAAREIAARRVALRRLDARVDGARDRRALRRRRLPPLQAVRAGGAAARELRDDLGSREGVAFDVERNSRRGEGECNGNEGDGRVMRNDGWGAAAQIPALVAVIAVSAFSCTSLGLVIGALGLRARDVFFLANLVVFSLLLFCGVNIPFDTLPSWMQTVGRSLPLTHGIEAAREIADGASLADVSTLVWTELGIGACYAAGAFLLFKLFELEGRRRASFESI